MKDLGDQNTIRFCPTCGVDAARAMVVSAVIAWYQPTYTCPQCLQTHYTLQLAANHLARHEPDLVRYVRRWIGEHL